MATHHLSTINDWLQFNGTNLPSIPTCLHAEFPEFITDPPKFTNASCAEVCSDSGSIFWNQSHNLLTCGLWTTVITANSFLDLDTGLHYDDSSHTSDLLKPFEESGLTLKAFQDSSGYASLISDCFEVIYLNVKRFSYSDNGQLPASCTKDQLFPFRPNATNSLYNGSSLGDCVDKICAPLTLDPDLAGIGVFSSFMIQSGLAILALLGLLCLELALKNFKKQSTIPRTQNLVAALVDFHKAQCYFQGVIQIAALTLFHKSREGSISANNEVDPTAFKDLFDTTVLIVLATGGFIPVNLTLACIARYGRQSWYLLMLTLTTTILASATLIASYNYSHKYGKGNFYENDVSYPFIEYNGYGGNTTATCRLPGYVYEVINPLCGNKNLFHNAIPVHAVANWWTWIVWVYSISWLFICIGKKAYETPRLHGFRGSVKSLGKRVPSIKILGQEQHVHKTWIAIAVLPWSLCFGSQFYLFASFFRHDLINYGWTFGQIIAVTVWIPCVVEYLYIEWNGIQEASKYRYPSPLMVVSKLGHSSVSLANLQSPEVNRDEEYSLVGRSDSGLPEYSPHVQ